MARLQRVLVCFAIDSDFGRKLCEGIHAYCASRANWTFDINSQKDRAAVVGAARGSDGIIAAAVQQTFADALVGCDLPCVNVATSPALLPTVRCDERLACRMGAEHLLERGFRRFAFCGSRVGCGCAQREDGFRQALQKAGHHCLSRYPPNTGDWRVLAADMCLWIGGLARPIAVMTSNDSLGHQVLNACLHLRIRVPLELAVLGTGNDRAIWHFTIPPFSSIPCNGRQVGYRAAALLDWTMAGDPATKQSILISPLAVVTRRSTAVLSSCDSDLAKAMNFIEEHPCDPIGVPDVVAAIRVPRRSLERHFRKVLGRSPLQQMHRVRVERAKKLLIESRLPVCQVAQTSGFCSPWQLHAASRKRVGTSPPGQFRKRFRHA